MKKLTAILVSLVISASLLPARAETPPGHKLEMFMGNAAAFYIGQPKMYTGGEVKYVDSENIAVLPYIKNGRTLVPLRAAGESIGAEISYNEIERSVTAVYNGETAVFPIGQNEFTLGGKEIPLDVAPEIRESRTFVPIRAISEGFGKKVSYDKCGLVVIADRENFFDLEKDLDLFRELTGKLCFHAPSGIEAVNKIKENFPDNKHPRLYADDDKIEVLRRRVKTDASVSKWFKGIRDYADTYIGTDPVVYDIYDGIRLLNISRKARSIMQELAFCYQMTGETKYADRCIKEMNAVCEFPDWNPSHFLDTAEMTEGLAFAYDWLYNYITPDFREKVKTAIIEMGLNQGVQDYRNKPEDRKRTYRWAQSSVADNWNIVCNSGLIQGAMAVCEDAPELAAEIFESGMKLLEKAVLMYGPDGAWYEGPGYWQYATEYFIDLCSCLDSVFSDTFGYLNAPGVSQTGYYITAITGPCGNFNFHDSAIPAVNAPELFFLADKLSDSALSALRTEQMKNRNTKGSIRDILYYNPELSGDSALMKKDYYFRDTEVAALRSDWNDYNAVFLGVHAGKTDVYHGHMDAGSFVLDGFGTRYACDLGADDYNIDDSVWNLYRYRAEGHNTLVINPSKDGGQKIEGAAKIDRFEYDDNDSLAVMDLTDMYDAKSVKRGFKLIDKRSAVIIQDEIKTDTPSDIWWFMHSAQGIEVSEDKKSATIKGEYRNLKISLLQDTPGEFSVMEAAPMETSPQNDSQNKNLKYRKLAFCAKNVTDLTIPMLLRFELPIEGAEEGIKPGVTKLDSWTLDNAETPKKPKLTSILADGREIEGFESDRFVYAYRGPSENEKAPEITARGQGEISVVTTGSVPGYAVVSVTENGETQHYVIKIEREILKKAPSDVLNFEIKGVEASDVPQPENNAENTIDENLATRWSAYGNAHIVYDLGEVKTIKYVGLAVYQDKSNDGRRQYFDISVSEDGENYRHIFTGETTGTTLEEEIFPIGEAKGRYVKIYCKGSSMGNWNSITECNIYGK